MNELTRRGAMRNSAIAAATVAGPVLGASAQEPSEKRKAERRFEGESKDGKLQEALDLALEQLDKAMGEGGVFDATGSWRLAEITGRRGGFAGQRSVRVTVAATRHPEWR